MGAPWSRPARREPAQQRRQTSQVRSPQMTSTWLAVPLIRSGTNSCVNRAVPQNT